MNENEKMYYKAFLNNYSRKDSLSVGWSTDKKQTLIHKALYSIVKNRQDDTVLDVGCGVGHLTRIIDNPKTYIGIDPIEGAIRSAREQYDKYTFHKAELSEYKKKADYVIACGTFNYNTGNNYAEIRENIDKMYALSNKGVAISLISNETPINKKGNELYYYDPIVTAHYCLIKYKRIRLITDYCLDDFTIYIYK